MYAKHLLNFQYVYFRNRLMNNRSFYVTFFLKFFVNSNILIYSDINIYIFIM